MLVIPRPANRSSTFPTPTRGTWARSQWSSNVSPVGGRLRSFRRSLERLHAPAWPVKGRAMTRETPSASGQHLASDRAARVELADGNRRLMRGAPGRHCPPRYRRSSLRTQVLCPEFVEHCRARCRVLPRTPATGAFGEFGDQLCGKAPGNGRERGLEHDHRKSSQCPVVLSFPALEGCAIPCAAGRRLGADALQGAAIAEAETRKVGKRTGLASPSARCRGCRFPVSPYCSWSQVAADAEAVEDNDGGLRRRTDGTVQIHRRTGARLSFPCVRSS
jgi:hypothetical protein